MSEPTCEEKLVACNYKLNTEKIKVAEMVGQCNEAKEELVKARDETRWAKAHLYYAQDKLRECEAKLKGQADG